jgi:uncharacterized protein YecT (DUF1311 family)
VRPQIGCSLLAASLLLTIANGAGAEDGKEKPHPIDAAFEACTEKDPSTAGMLACAGEAEAAWDKELNAAYQELVSSLKGKQLDALREAQRAWVAQRDKEHALQEAIRGELQGTMWGPVMADQRTSLVKARALQLRAYKSFLDDGRP